MTNWPEFNRTEQFMLLENGNRVYRAIITEEQYNQARAAIAVMRWRPIETAPKDGTEILAYLITSCESIVYMDIILWSAVGADKDCGWLTCHGVEVYSTPIRWMPLPPQPTGDL